MKVIKQITMITMMMMMMMVGVVITIQDIPVQFVIFLQLVELSMITIQFRKGLSHLFPLIELSHTAAGLSTLA